ncbi:MAG: DUF4129 domain-containing protein [Chloroflexota bacterium]
MRTFFTNKFWIILLSVLALGALMGLAIGLKNISFDEAQPFGREEARTARSAPLDLINAVMSIPLKTQLGIWILFIMFFVFIGMLMSPEMRKRLIKIVIRVAITYWALWILFSRYRDVLAQIGLNLTPPSGAAEAGSNGAPVPQFTPPPAASWLAYLVSFGIVALVIIVVWKLNAIWKELNAPVTASPMKKLANIARSSLRDLSAGRDSTDVIMDCYYRMSDTVLEKKNMDRSTSMTPSEFATQLEQAGLPSDAVRKLTRLFEAVRYGGHKSDPAAVNEAVTCLTTIVHYCGETV